MIARTPRKLVLIAGTVQNARDLTGRRPTFANYYYTSGAGTVEISKAAVFTAGQGFPVQPDAVYHDYDQSHERYLLATGGNVDIYIEEFE